MVKSSSKSLLQIINDILDLSKIEAGKVELAHEYIDIFSLIDNNERIYATLANNKNLILTIKVERMFQRKYSLILFD